MYLHFRVCVRVCACVHVCVCVYTVVQSAMVMVWMALQPAEHSRTNVRHTTQENVRL